MKALVRKIESLARGLRKPRARHYVRSGISVDGFFDALAERGVQYAVLRWFEPLPYIDPGEDLDLLVADAGIGKLQDLFVPWRTKLACDVYSVSGLPGSEFRKMAYMPPHLSAGVLERAVLLRGRYRVPCTEDHFRSLAYHALYHKGVASGLPSATPGAAAAAKKPDHDYAAVLGALARELGVAVDLTLEALDDHLAAVGWRPPQDMLARLALRNDWLRGRLSAHAPMIDPSLRGVAVFVLRQQALARPAAGRIAALLQARGFTLLLDDTLGAEHQAESARRLRGGNWGPGPYAVAGGPPARALVVWDGAPQRVPRQQRERYPLLDNGRVLAAKLAIRDALIEELPKRERFNPLHSSDNDAQAWEYLEALVPGALPMLRDRVAALNASRP